MELSFYRWNKEMGIEVYEGEALLEGMGFLRNGQGIRRILDSSGKELEKMDGEWKNHGIKKIKYSSSIGHSFDLEMDEEGTLWWYFTDGTIWEGNGFDQGILTKSDSTIISLENPIVGTEIYQGGAILSSVNGGTVLKHGHGLVTIVSEDEKELESLQGEWKEGICINGNYRSHNGSNLKIEGQKCYGTLVEAGTKNEINGEETDGVFQ